MATSADPADEDGRAPPVSQDEFCAPIEALPDPAFVAAAQRNADGEIIEFRVAAANQAALRMFGRSSAEIVGRGLLESVPGLHGSDFWSAALDVVHTGGPARIEVPSFDGSEACGNLELHAAKFDDGIIVTAHDISEREELKGRAAQSEAAVRSLQRSNTDLQQFTRVASHDLAEPIRAIAGPLTYIAEHNRGKLDDVTDEFIDLALDGCNRMQNMIKGMLAFSRVEQSEHVRTRAISGQLVRDAIAGVRPLIDSSHAVVVTVEPLPIVLAQPDQISQVFQNLISNAVKFVAPGVVPYITIDAEREGSSWRFTVTDNGIGIPPAQRERVFTMFKRVHTLDDYPGSGIGLAIVKRIVERHGGSVGVEAAPTGTGSRFWFTLSAPDGESHG